MRRRSIDILRGLAALLILAAILVAVPWALVTQVGWPLPTVLPSWDEFSRTLTRGDLQDWTIIKALAVLVWLSWAQVAAGVVAEVVALARRRPALRVPGTAALRSVATNLVASVAVLVSTVGRPSVAIEDPAPVLAVALVDGAAAGHTATSPSPLPDPPGDSVTSHTAEQAATSDDAPRWTVRQRDTLWDIAEQCLGDGLRWREIHRLNAGRVQHDGGALGDDGHIRPGWVLVLPEKASDRSAAAEASPGPDESGQPEVVVESGDTLWDLSEEHLGDPYRWPDIYDENRGVVQPDGRRLTDPDLIQPGWVLELPTETGSVNGQDANSSSTTAEDPSGTGVPDDEAPPVLDDHESTSVGEHVPSEDVSSATPPSLSEQPRLEDESPEGERGDASSEIDEAPSADHVVAIAGIAVTAAGVAATLDRIRRARRRRRRPGERIRLPDGPTAEAELRIRGLADADASSHIDGSLRSLAVACEREGRPVPPIVLVSSSAADLAVHLAKPDEAAPEGWRSEDGGLTWVLRPEGVGPATESMRHISNPAPLLASLGTAADGQR